MKHLNPWYGSNQVLSRHRSQWTKRQKMRWLVVSTYMKGTCLIRDPSSVIIAFSLLQEATLTLEKIFNSIYLLFLTTGQTELTNEKCFHLEWISTFEPRLSGHFRSCIPWNLLPLDDVCSIYVYSVDPKKEKKEEEKREVRMISESAHQAQGRIASWLEFSDLYFHLIILPYFFLLSPQLIFLSANSTQRIILHIEEEGETRSSSYLPLWTITTNRHSALPPRGPSTYSPSPQS